MNNKRKVTFQLLYKNGIEEEYNRETDFETLEGISKIVNEAFKTGQEAVIRLNDDEVANIIRVSDLSRFSVIFLD